MSLKKNLGLRWFKMDFKLQPMTSPCLHCSSLTACRNANCRGGMSTVLHVLNNVLPWTPLPQLPYLMSYLGFGLDFCSAGDICNRGIISFQRESWTSKQFGINHRWLSGSRCTNLPAHTQMREPAPHSWPLACAYCAVHIFVGTHTYYISKMI